jgi:hypothetical protein
VECDPCILLRKEHELLPLNKTIVTTLTQTLADRVTQSKLGYIQASTKVPQCIPFFTTDVDISYEHPFVLPTIQSMVTITGYGCFNLALRDLVSGFYSTIKVDRLFVFHGSSDLEFKLYRDEGEKPLRCSIVLA